MNEEGPTFGQLSQMMRCELCLWLFDAQLLFLNRSKVHFIEPYGSNVQ